MWEFIAGFIFGGFIGIVIMSLVKMGSDKE